MAEEKLVEQQVVKEQLASLVADTSEAITLTLDRFKTRPRVREVGWVQSILKGVVYLRGLPTVKSNELVRFKDGLEGMALNLDPDQVGVVLLGNPTGLQAGDIAHRTHRVLDVPVGEGLLGRVVNPLGNPLDEKGAIRSESRLPIEREAPGVMDRQPVQEPLQTGIKVIDALLPIGRGQRELILGDRQTGKTSIALDTILNQREEDVLCVYCAIGQRNAAVAGLVEDLRTHDALRYTIVMVASGNEPPGLQYVAPYAATSIAEYFRDRGRDVLIVYDDLTQHARAYRELSLLLRRPPGREAYPGDIFYIHSRLLERSTHLSDEHGGGSLTALPIIETQAQNISAYIPTNLISITDGQIYLSPNLYQKGILPAVDIGRSVSRVGGKAQLPAYREVSSDLRLAYSQFEELEVFTRFGTRLEEETQRQLERGRRVREVFKQPLHQTMPVSEQIAVLLAVTEGMMDDLPVEMVSAASQAIRAAIRNQIPGIHERIASGVQLDDRDMEKLFGTIRQAVESVSEEKEPGPPEGNLQGV